MDALTKVTTEEAAKTANGLMTRIFGPAADGLGIILSQPIKERVVFNQLRALEKLRTKLSKEGASLRQVNLKVLFPYLDGISVEEDPELEDLWANLMANYLDSDKNLETTVYPSILKQISSNEAKALELFYEGSFVTVFADNKKTLMRFENEKVLQDKFEGPINNLYRLGLLEHEKTPARISTGLSDYITALFNMYKISPFGKDFYKACHRN